jgi:sensor histidine kinase YesM
MDFTISNPILNRREGLYYYLAIWLVIAALHALVLRHMHELHLSWATSILDSAVFNFLFAILGLGFWYPSKFISLEKGKAARVLLSHTLASVVISTLWVGAGYTILKNLIVDEPNYQPFLYSSIFIRLLIGVLLYFVLVAFYYVLIYYQHFHQKQMQEAELKSLVREAELRTLKFQINPHFIFNSLNSINALTLSDPARAGEMTVKLGDYLRSTLSKNDQQQSTLKEELDSAKLYLDIEKVRFGEKFEFLESVERPCLETRVPNMLLQPLFENAIKHGVYESLEKVQIKFTCRQQGDYVQITVENDFDPRAPSRRGKGIGLENIQHRLRMTYHQENLLRIEKEDQLFRVHILIPNDARPAWQKP